MAIKLITVLEHDLDGSEAAETIIFALDGSAFEIDLNSSHAQELRAALGPYIDAARKVPAGLQPKRQSRNTGATPAKIRAWAHEQGLAVNSRGRINADVLAQHEAARKPTA